MNFLIVGNLYKCRAFEALDYERDRISESLWYLSHDLSERRKRARIF